MALRYLTKTDGVLKRCVVNIYTRTRGDVLTYMFINLLWIELLAKIKPHRDVTSKKEKGFRRNLQQFVESLHGFI